VPVAQSRRHRRPSFSARPGRTTSSSQESSFARVSRSQRAPNPGGLGTLINTSCRGQRGLTPAAEVSHPSAMMAPRRRTRQMRKIRTGMVGRYAGRPSPTTHCPLRPQTTCTPRLWGRSHLSRGTVMKPSVLVERVVVDEEAVWLFAEAGQCACADKALLGLLLGEVGAKNFRSSPLSSSQTSSQASSRSRRSPRPSLAGLRS
jgi:hypothetical protein